MKSMTQTKTWNPTLSAAALLALAAQLLRHVHAQVRTQQTQVTSSRPAATDTCHDIGCLRPGCPGNLGAVQDEMIRAKVLAQGHAATSQCLTVSAGDPGHPCPQQR
jgi:hypothetical protein